MIRPAAGAAWFSLGGYPPPCALVTLPFAAPAPPVPLRSATLPGGVSFEPMEAIGFGIDRVCPTPLPLAAPLSGDCPEPLVLGGVSGGLGGILIFSGFFGGFFFSDCET